MLTEKQPGAPRIALVSYSASKSKKSASARELYTSALLGAAYTYAEKTYDAVLTVSAFYGVVASKEEVTNVNETAMAFKVLMANLLDAANRFSSQESSNTIRAYCIVLLDLGWQGDGAVPIRNGLHKVCVLRSERGSRGDTHRRATGRQHGERSRVVQRQRAS